MKKLSIITTLYNSAKYLPKCLESLLCQDIPELDYEIIVVNDGSPDNSEEIARDYAQKSGSIRVITQENKGLAGARNTGLRAAEGKYLCFVDPDDFILENSFNVVLEKMDSDQLDVLRFGYSEVDEDYQPTKSSKNPVQIDYSPQIMDGYAFLAERMGIACYVWTFIFRTAFLRDNGIFFYEGKYYDDSPWLPRVLAQAKRVDSMDYKRYFYLIRHDSLVQSRSEDAILRKIDGQRFLIDEFSRQHRYCPIGKAREWYEMMISHCVGSILTLVAIYRFKERHHYINDLKQKGVFPLSLNRVSGLKKFRLFLINFSPNLFCRLVFYKNRSNDS